MNLQSKELFINMKEGDIPFWNPVYQFEEQDDDVKQFWMNEAMKLAEGLTVNGVYIHPWLYWHINFWKMMIDLDPELNAGVERIPGRSELRDNEWFFAELLKQAEEENKGIFMFGTRRFGKALLNSEIVYLENGEKTMGEILVGDRIYDDKGKLTTVQGVYPQGKVMTYRVIFEDGRSVVCSGDHLWRVKYNKTWHIQTLKSLFGQDLGDITIQMQQPLDYPDSKVPFPPDTYAQLTANHLMGNIGGIPYNSQIARSYLRSSIRQKKIFVEEFLKTLTGVVSGEEVFEVSHYVDRKVLNFVHRMFWSYGWYAGMDGNELCLSSFRDELKITDVTVYGKQDATCIKVDNQSHLFLTTNYIVTHNTAIMSSYLARNATMTYNLTHNVIGASKEDLAQMTEYLEFGLDNLPPFLKINRTGNDWTKEVILGNSTVRNERDIHARIRIVNIDSGKSGAALKPAGGTPYTTIYDEVGKFPFLGPYLAGQPSHMMHGKMRGMILASGCVCAGSMIGIMDGAEKRVERIREGDVVLGCDIEHMNARYNMVDYVKESMGKPCYRVTAVRSDGERMKLECSFDHPFKMVGDGSGRDSVYPGYVAAIRLIPGDLVYVYSYGSGENARYTYATIEDVEELGVQEVFNFRVGRDHNYVANGFLTHNTGGNVEKSADAQKVMNSPEDYRFIIMNYDLLNKRTTRPTWRIGKTGCFVPAQMSHAFTKHETTLDKYLGMSDAPDLNKIKIKVSDFDENTDKIKEDRNELAKKDRSLYVQRKMAYPLTVDDCFLNANVNRFPVEDILVHKNRLLEEGRPGKLVDVYQVEGKRMGWHFSEKTLASYPFQGGNIDCPVVIYEDPPEIGGNFDYVYTSGCLLPGEPVLTDKGWKPVEMVSKGDKLVDKDGNYVDILEFQKFDKENEDVYGLKLTGCATVTMLTKEHPVYASPDIHIHGYALDEKRFDFDYRKVSDIKKKSWVAFPNIYRKVIDPTPYMRFYECSVDFWWLIGFYLGNGYIDDAGRITVYVNQKEVEVSERIYRIFTNNFRGTYYTRVGNNCENITSYNPELCGWILHNFGRHSYGKVIPEWVKFLPEDYKVALIHGYLDSDGSITSHTKGYIYTEFVSVNLPMLEAFQHIMFSIGVIGCISKLRDANKYVGEKIGDREIKTQRSCYHLRIGNFYSVELKDMIVKHTGIISPRMKKMEIPLVIKKRKNTGMFFSSDMSKIYIQVDDVVKDSYTGTVYNFHCENSNYCCVNMNTHNCDPYKQDKADTESLGAFYIFKRLININDSFAYKIVASYVSRPAISEDFCRTCEILQEAYGAKCLMENADRMYELYLSRRNKEMLLLENGEVIANKIIRSGSRQNNKLGLSPTVPNQRMLYNTVLQYCWEDVVIGYDEDGNEITEKGVYRIPDIELLDEMVAFGQGVNTDRIIAFGHALLLAKYYDDMGFMPTSKTQQANEEKFKQRKQWVVHGFSTRRRNPYATPRFR